MYYSYKNVQEEPISWYDTTIIVKGHFNITKL